MPIALTLALFLMAIRVSPEPAQPAPATTLPRFRLTLLQVPAGIEQSTAVAINERGQIAGLVLPPWEAQPFYFTAFWSDAQALAEIATGPGTDFATPSDVGPSGLVLGNGFIDGFGGGGVPFTWIAGEDIEPLADVGDITAVFVCGINDRGVLVGEAVFPELLSARPTRWDHGVPQALRLVPGDHSGNAFAISDSGHIVGRSGELAARWLGTEVQRLEFPNAADSIAVDVNDRGFAVGDAFVGSSGGFQAVLWRGTEGVALPTLGGGLSRAYAINDRDWIAGTSEAFPPIATSLDDLRATLWIHEQAYDLNELTVDLPAGVVLTAAWDLNDTGQIVGRAIVDDLPRAFLLDRVDL